MTELKAFNTNETFNFRQNDNISHFICRLAYCRNDELRKWFLTQESRLFNLRLQGADPQKIKEIIIHNFGLNYESVKETDEEWKKSKADITFNFVKEKEKEKDKNSTLRPEERIPKPEDYIKVPFKEALNLVATRQVYVHKGIAYVPLTKLTTIA